MGATGLHNILEPAVFGVPIIIGKNHSKFPEAQQMIDFGGLKSIKNEDELNSELTSIIENASKRNQMGSLNKEFIDLNKGAIQKITNYLK